MVLSLNSHKDGYNLTKIQMVTLFLGPTSAYGRRHFALIKKSEGFFPKTGHCLIGICEIIPIAGGLVSIIERICVAISSCFSSAKKDDISKDRTTCEGMEKQEIEKKPDETEDLTCDPKDIQIGEQIEGLKKNSAEKDKEPGEKSNNKESPPPSLSISIDKSAEPSPEKNGDAFELV